LHDFKDRLIYVYSDRDTNGYLCLECDMMYLRYAYGALGGQVTVSDRTEVPRRLTFDRCHDGQNVIAENDPLAPRGRRAGVL
jgi:hypothetical protein